MRTNRLLLLIGSAVVLLFFGCTRENPNDTGEAELTAIYSPDETRTSYSDNTGTNFSWDVGDNIGIMLSDRSVVLGTLTPYNDPTRAKVTYTGGTRAFHAIYPRESFRDELGFVENNYSGENAYFIRYKNEYDASDYSVPLPMYAENTDGNNKLLFRHLCGLLRITCKNVPSGTKYLTVTSNSGTKLTGDIPFLYEYGDSYTAYSSGAINPGNEIDYSVSSSANLSELKINVPVPLSYTSFKITAKDATKNIIKQLLIDYAPISSPRGKGYHAVIDFNDPYYEIEFGCTYKNGEYLGNSGQTTSYSASLVLSDKGKKYSESNVYLQQSGDYKRITCYADHITISSTGLSSCFYINIAPQYKLGPSSIELICSASRKYATSSVEDARIAVSLNTNSSWNQYQIYNASDSWEDIVHVSIPYTAASQFIRVALKQGDDAGEIKIYAIRVHYSQFTNSI